MSIPQTFIQELLARTDVVEVVGRYVPLRKGGANYMGLCPFHGEKSPSFSVSPTKQFYHCFGCGVSGDAIAFLMAHTGQSFVEAVSDLAQQAGLTIPEDNASAQDRDRAQRLREQQLSLTALLEQAAKAYQHQLKIAPRAVAYLKGRGLSGEVARTYGMGYAPPGWRSLAGLLPDYNDPRLVESGLVIASDPVENTVQTSPTTPTAVGSATAEGKRYDRFRDRIMFPIRNIKGETIGFGGRVLDKGEPKYLNSPETPVFSKGRELYGLFEARTAIRTAGYALVTEGYMDVVALAQLGFPNTVATLGTACTPEHIQKLFRFTDSITFSFDGDGAGRRAARKALDAALPFAQDTRTVRFLFLPTEHDPDSFIRTQGAEAFSEAVKRAVPLSRFLLDSAQADCDLNTPEGRAQAISHARPLWSSLPEGALKMQLLAELATLVNLRPQELTDLWNSPRKESRQSHNIYSNEVNTDVPEEHFFHENYSPAPAARHSGAPWTKGTGRKWEPGNRWQRGNNGPRAPREPPLDGPVVSRADHLARLMLEHPNAWVWLNSDDHHLLAALPMPHGGLFAWLEAQWHEHGAQPWAVLQTNMQGQVFESLALQLTRQAQALARPVTQEEAPPNAETGDNAQRELRELMGRLHIDDLKLRETQAISRATTDASALQTYRELQARRRELEQQIQPLKV